MTDLREIIKDAMNTHNCTISSAARVAGMTQPQLSEYLAGQRDVRGATLGRLMDALHVRIKGPTQQKAARTYGNTSTP